MIVPELKCLIEKLKSIYSIWPVIRYSTRFVSKLYNFDEGQNQIKLTLLLINYTNVNLILFGIYLQVFNSRLFSKYSFICQNYNY